MKQILFFTALFICFNANSQALKRLSNRAKQKVENVAGQKVDKAIDDAVDGKKKTPANKSVDEENNSEDQNEATTTATANTSLKAYSKYDFVPGEKIIAYEDFSIAAIGDFPTRWNTNATAEVVTINNRAGKWLKIVKEGVFHPEFITALPDNFTFEFDLAVNPEWRGTHIAVNMANLKTPQDYANYYHYVSWRGDHAVHMQLKPGQNTRTSANSKLIAGTSGNHTLNNDVDFKGWDNASNNFVHVSMWRQGQRLRVYANGQKIWDIPRAFDASSKYNAITFGMQDSHGTDDYMLLGNLQLAVGAPDTRNKLITEGKFVTRGILFDVSSDGIKPESSGALKEIATVLKENSDLKVKIVGHTDSDGDDDANMELSKKRSSAVKAALVKEFGINEANLETDGKGESEPVDKNTTSEGKANNRRVEFVKI